jgi:hypothetical protein
VASGDWGTVGGGFKNTASGLQSVVAGGTTNTASNSYSSVLGGNSNTAGNYGSVAVGGVANNASGYGASCLGGYLNTASGTYSTVLGWIGSGRALTGYTAFSSSAITQSSGVSQTGILTIGTQTTNATATVLTSDAGAAGTTNQVILPNNSAYYFKASIISGVTGGGNSKSWTIEGLIKRGAGVGTTSLVGTPVVNTIAQDTGASTWAIAATADTTNGGLTITFTGQASTTIRTVCKVETTEMTY